MWSKGSHRLALDAARAAYDDLPTSGKVPRLLHQTDHPAARVPDEDEHFVPNVEAEAQGRTSRADPCRLTCGSVTAGVIW